MDGSRNDIQRIRRQAAAHMAVTPVALLLAAGSLRLAGIELAGWGLLGLALLAAGYSLPLHVLASFPLERRLDRLSQVTSAWLRGNLRARLSDPSNDEIGLLASQLDLLAHQLEQDERDLSEERARSTRLASQVRELAVVEERNRLARDLHDGVKQYLFSLGMTASAVKARVEALAKARVPAEDSAALPEDLVEMAADVETTAHSAQREMARLIDDLRPVSLQQTGLAGALNSYTLLFGARERLLVYLDVKGSDSHLPLSTSEALYRTAQEALLNVARHAMATRVDISLTALPEQVILVIHDNGAGFDLSHPTKGLGLASMQERIMAVGGRLTLRSQPGEGTTVTAEVALSRPQALAPKTEVERQVAVQPSIESWSWLGQRLEIPVGQVWPWLPADQLHLRRPLVDPSSYPFSLALSEDWFGLRRLHTLVSEDGLRLPAIARLFGRYFWRADGATWEVAHPLRASSTGRLGQAVLNRKGQPLAAMQYQGRLLNTWSEIVYDGHGYSLAFDDDWRYGLYDETGEVLLTALDGPPLQVSIERALPLPLLMMATVRMIEEKYLEG